MAACSSSENPDDEGMPFDHFGKQVVGRKIGYMRVSDHDQTANLQRDALTAAGCDVIYADHGISGTVTAREGLSDVLAELQAGDALVVWKLDRLGRSTVHLLQLLAELRERGVDFIALTQGIDTTTAVGRMLYGQLAVFAEFEREQISDRTKAGMAAARKRGTHVGRPPILTAVQIRAAIHAIRVEGRSIREVARDLDVSPQTLVRAMRGR